MYIIGGFSLINIDKTTFHFLIKIKFISSRMKLIHLKNEGKFSLIIEIIVLILTHVKIIQRNLEWTGPLAVEPMITF